MGYVQFMGISVWLEFNWPISRHILDSYVVSGHFGYGVKETCHGRLTFQWAEHLLEAVFGLDVDKREFPVISCRHVDWVYSIGGDR